VKLSDFDYYLPPELIAQEPAEKRDESRLMVVPKDGGPFEHRRFRDLVEYTRFGDVLVVNETKVLPARLIGVKKGTGARVEILLLKNAGGSRWEVLAKPGKKVTPGSLLSFGGGELEALVEGVTDYGGRVVDLKYSGRLEDVLERVGLIPLPPYIKKPLPDGNRYQTVYARCAGSAAAPTAGLHFTPELMKKIREKGVEIVPVLLHVGLGTFRPVKVDDITEHRMHAEYYEISEEAARVINAVKRRGGRVIAVGTTTTRCLESAAAARGEVRPGAGWTDIFIYPGYRFLAIDGLITNFHLPKSTLLMMVSALAGRERILCAYREAVSLGYRFFSFGDAMLII